FRTGGDSGLVAAASRTDNSPAAEAKLSSGRDLNLETLHADCLVVGAGPAGSTVARLLALKGRGVIRADPGSLAVNRLELLAPASLSTVAAVGLQPLLDDPAVARRCLGIRRTRGSGEQDYEDFLCHPYRVGYVIDRARFDERLRAAAVAAGVTFCRLRASGLTADADVNFRATDSSATTVVCADVIIDATGRAAAIARRKGARVTARDHMVAELTQDTPKMPLLRARRGSTSGATHRAGSTISTDRKGGPRLGAFARLERRRETRYSA